MQIIMIESSGCQTKIASRAYLNADGNPCITSRISNIAEHIRTFVDFSAGYRLRLDICHCSNSILQDCLFECMHCKCQARGVRDGAQQRRGAICQKPILFLHNSKARKSKVRCKPCRPLRSPESHNKSHKNCHYRDYFSLSLQSPSSSVVHTFQQRALHSQCDRNGQLLACFSALP